MWTRQLLAKAVFNIGLIFLVTSAEAAHADSWTFLGRKGENYGAPEDVYIVWEEVKPWGDGLFSVWTLSVSPVTQAGVSFSTPDGRVYNDLSYPYKSRVAHELFHCGKRVSALVREIYFPGDRPVRGQEILERVEKEFFFMEEPLKGLEADGFVINAVCAPPRWP